MLGHWGMALLESGALLEVSLWVGFGVSSAQARPSISLCLMPTNPDVGLLAISPAPCLPTSHHTPSLDNNELNF